MSQTLIVVRHGETSFNRDKIFCGWIDVALDPKGIREGKQLAKKLRDEEIDFGFASDLIRGKQTLAYILEYHKKAKVIIDHRLRERNYGVFSGHSKELFKKLFPEWYEQIHRGYYAKVPKGENFYQVGKRVFPFMNDLLAFMKKTEGNVILSAHSNSMRVIQEYLENLTPEQTSRLENKPGAYKKYKISFKE